MKDILVIADNSGVVPEGSKLDDLEPKSFEILKEAIDYALEIHKKWRTVKVWHLKGPEEVITIEDNKISWGGNIFIKDGTYKMKDGTTFTWDGNETAESILQHRENLIAWKNKKLG